MRKYLLIVCFILLPFRVWASCSNCTTSTASCTSGTTVAQINTCLGSLPDGGTINFAAGSYTWNGSINIQYNKAASLIGAGAGVSNVNSSGGTITNDSTGYITATGQYRISGFTFSGGIPGGSALLYFYAAAGTTVTLRVDNNTFSGLDPGGANSTAVLLAGTDWCPNGCGIVNGVMDHNTFTGTDNFMAVKVFGHKDSVAETVSHKGTVDNFYVEDNTFSFTNLTNAGNGCVDVWDSGSMVFRHNTVTNCLICAHEESHGGGTLNMEVYNNSLTNNAGQYTDGTRLIHHQGSGEFFAFNNTFYTPNTKSTDPLDLTEYRSCPPAQTGSTMNECDGTQSVDGNWSPTGTYYGYPCWRQSGRMLAGSRTSTGQPGTLSPVYVWNNYWSDTSAQVSLAVTNPWGCSNPSPATHLAANRDYYNAVSASAQSNATTPFNGTTGMGFGTLANRPTTCTTNANESGGGVGYAAMTVVGTIGASSGTGTATNAALYRCSATDTWTVQYTPYTYPHPLVGGSAPTPSAPVLGPGVTISGVSFQ